MTTATPITEASIRRNCGNLDSEEDLDTFATDVHDLDNLSLIWTLINAVKVKAANPRHDVNDYVISTIEGELLNRLA